MNGRVVVAVVLLCLIAGCLPTYVGDPEKSIVDPQLLGIWHTQGDQEQLWYVHSLDAHSYLVQCYSFDRKDGVATLKGQAMTSRAWLTPIAGKQFISLQTFDPRQITDPTADPSVNRYVVAKVDLQGDTLTAQGISPDFVKNNHIAKPEEFEQALAAHVDEKTTYIDPDTYERVDIKKPGAAGELIDLVRNAADGN